MASTPQPVRRRPPSTVVDARSNPSHHGFPRDENYSILPPLRVSHILASSSSSVPHIARARDVIDAHGAPLPRSGRTNRKPNANARRIEARTSGGRLTRSTRVDGDVHARAQRGGAGGGHGKHPSFGARLRVEDASSGDSGVDGGTIAVSVAEGVRVSHDGLTDVCMYHHHHPCRLLVNVCFGSTSVYNFYCMCSVGLGFREVYHARRVDL